MRTFVYDSRVIENERQIKFERNAKQFGNIIGMVVKFLVAFIFFVVFNALINTIAQHSNIFSVNTWRFIEEATRVLVVENAFATNFLSQNVICFVLALSFTCFSELGLMVQVGNGVGRSSEKKQQRTKEREAGLQTFNQHNFVSYKDKVCFLS